MNVTNRLKKTLLLGVLVAAFTVAAGPVSAFAPEADAAFEPAPTESAERIAEDPAAPIVEPGAPPPEDDFTRPTIPEVSQTVPPKIDAASFGVGWPAAVAVGVALLAVLIMALTWKRDETW